VKPSAILMGPFVGEFYWEGGRFAPMLPFMKFKEFKKQDHKYIILTREERFDLYGRYADILVPLRIEGDYVDKFPECFRLQNYSDKDYDKLATKFRSKYEEEFQIVKHLYPSVAKKRYLDKNQYLNSKMLFQFAPRQQNYDLVNSYLPQDEKPLVVLAPRFRVGFKRNWSNWLLFYDILASSKLNEEFRFIICGKKNEYQPDPKKRFLDINDIPLGEKSSLAGFLLVILEKAFFTFGSQSSIPNFSLLYKVNVLEFGCQKTLHTATYNVTKTPITFIENPKYDLAAQDAFAHLEKLLKEKKKNVISKKRMV